MTDEALKETRSIKMQVLDIIKETIKTKLDTVSRIDGKM
jgi:uncharacterized protein YnzC (UPF0291/DUF896 family)